MVLTVKKKRNNHNKKMFINLSNKQTKIQGKKKLFLDALSTITTNSFSSYTPNLDEIELRSLTDIHTFLPEVQQEREKCLEIYISFLSLVRDYPYF